MKIVGHKGMALAGLVRATHLILIAFMLWAPICGSLPTLLLVEAGYLLLFLHWLLNNDTCALTMLEQRLRGIQKSSSFIHSIVGPVYNVSSTSTGKLVWWISLLLFSVGLVRLWLYRTSSQK